MNEIKRLQQLAGINEIKVNRPKRIWDLTKYNPNFTGKDIQIGDEIKLLKQYNPHNRLIIINSIEDDIQDEKEYYALGIGYYTSDWLRNINNRNKIK